MSNDTSAFNSNEYDDKIKRTLPYYEEFYKQVIDVVNVCKNDPLEWLDVGCGTGKMAEVALNRTNIKNFIFCDHSADMINLAKKRYHSAKTEFIISSVQEIDFCNQFDVVTAIQVNHYLHKEGRIQAVKNCHNALRNGGIFITFENFAPFSDIGKDLFIKRWRNYQLSQGKSENACDSHLSRYNKDYFPITLSEHLKIMYACGFKTVEIIWLSYMQVGILGIK